MLSDQVAYLPENSLPGVTVGKPMKFDDPDFAQNHEFSIEQGNDDGIFAIHKNGQVIVAQDKIDFETDTVYLLEIKITDSGDSMRKRLSDTATMTVYVMDVNEPPYFPFLVRIGCGMCQKGHRVGSW